MRRVQLATAAAVALVGAAIAAPTAGSSASVMDQGVKERPTGPTSDTRSYSDNFLNPLQQKQIALRQEALQKRLRSGSTRSVLKVGDGQYAKVEQTGKDKIFVVLAEFGSTEHSAYPDGESDAQRVNGPWHNQIPKPDRSVDNSTLWKKNYSPGHYRNMYFNRMQEYYEHQSSGRYTFGGQVTEWVKVPFNQARYGRDYCPSVACSNTWFLVRDALA